MQSDAKREVGLMTTISVSKRKYEKLSSMISPLTKSGGGSSYNNGTMLKHGSCERMVSKSLSNTGRNRNIWIRKVNFTDRL